MAHYINISSPAPLAATDLITTPLGIHVHRQFLIIQVDGENISKQRKGHVKNLYLALYFSNVSPLSFFN